MKVSELGTDRALDVLCELTPYVDNIVSDETFMESIGKAADTSGLTKYGILILFAKRVVASIPVLLKTHRPDIYSILSVLEGTGAEEIAAQPLTVTLVQIHDALNDEALADFFRSFGRRGASARSAPSAPAKG